MSVTNIKTCYNSHDFHSFVNRMKSIAKVCALVLFSIPAQASSFIDDFSRIDGSVGNGWSVMGKNGCTAAISAGRVTSASLTGENCNFNGAFMISRPVDLQSNFQASLQIGEIFGFAPGQFSTFVTFGATGIDSTDQGWGVFIYKGDNNFPASKLILVGNGIEIEEISVPFTFTPSIDLGLELSSSGLISGQVEAGLYSHSFSFSSAIGPLANSRFSIIQSAGTSIGTAAIDNVNLSAVPPAIPEPDSWAMLLAGFALTGAAVRRQRRMAAKI